MGQLKEYQPSNTTEKRGSNSLKLKKNVLALSKTKMCPKISLTMCLIGIVS